MVVVVVINNTTTTMCKSCFPFNVICVPGPLLLLPSCTTTDIFILLLAQTADLAKLLYFESSKDEPGKLCSLDDYVGRLEPEQKEIYYLMAPNRDLAGVCLIPSHLHCHLLCHLT